MIDLYDWEDKIYGDPDGSILQQRTWPPKSSHKTTTGKWNSE